ncbi:MAG: helix-turn-helix domain-containing protein [Clostridia bacterium]|nr:helix-turn-helix domain-containing protein [Clostridia bacterium]MBR3195348.1 helix-turn-helix domain-containing protein [Clostridia bacterium]
MSQADRRGYLKEDFRVFHLKDKSTQVDFHYHDFDKIVVFISGTTSYIIEGRTYKLQPGDVLFVPHHETHRPVADQNAPYERVVFWIDPEFLRRSSSEKTDLSRCFAEAKEHQRNLCRPWPEMKIRLSRLIDDVEKAEQSQDFGADLLLEATFLRLIVYFNRLIRALPNVQEEEFDYDPKINRVLRYINDNLQSDLSIDTIAAEYYLSRYHFMRKFKEVTGYTVHNYVRQKRLAYASRLITDGASPSEAAEQSGFTDYSSFLRAFKQQFGTTPKQYAQNAYNRAEIID